MCLRLGLSALSTDRAKIKARGKLLNYLAELSPTRLGGADESSAMEYKQFIVKLFEREPGKWRATVRRSDGRPDGLRPRKSETRRICYWHSAMTAEAALLAAMAAIDAGAFAEGRRAGLRIGKPKSGSAMETSDRVCFASVSRQSKSATPNKQKLPPHVRPERVKPFRASGCFVAMSQRDADEIG